MIASLPFAALAEAVGPVDGVEVVVWDGSGEPPRDDIEFLVPDYRHATQTLGWFDRLTQVRVVQTQTAGVDGLVELVPDGVVLANARGVHDDATAELALGLTIASLRGIDLAVREHGHWRPTGANGAAWPTAASSCWATAPSAGPSRSGCWPAGPWSRRSRPPLATTTWSAGW